MKKTVSLFVVIVFLSIIVFATPQEARADLETAQKTSDTLLVLSLACAAGVLALVLFSGSKNNRNNAEVLEKEGIHLASSGYPTGKLHLNEQKRLSEELPGKKVERIISFSYNF